MKRFRLSPEAAADIRQIWAYVAEDSLKAARRVGWHLFAACQRIAENPGIGHKREDLTQAPVLSWSVGSYPIIYAPQRKPLAIVRTLHGARDVTSELQWP